MSDVSAVFRPVRRVPAWHRRWLLLARLYRELFFEYRNLFGLWRAEPAAFWQYVLRLEEWRLVHEAVRRGDACAWPRPSEVPTAGDWRHV